MADRNHAFNDVVLRAIDDAISSLFSRQVLEALYLNLKEKRGISREEVPDQLNALSTVLEEYFGQSAQIICNAIAKSLYSKLNIEFRPRMKYRVADYAEEAKRLSRQK